MSESQSWAGGVDTGKSEAKLNHDSKDRWGCLPQLAICPLAEQKSVQFQFQWDRQRVRQAEKVSHGEMARAYECNPLLQ